MTNNSQHKALSFKYAFAYAGTLALVASAAFFPSLTADATLSSLRGLVFAQESSYAQSGVRTQEMGRSSIRTYYAFVILLALFGACVIASAYSTPHPKTQFHIIYNPIQLVPVREYVLPLIRGPSL